MISMMARHIFYDGLDGFKPQPVIESMTSLIYHIPEGQRGANQKAQALATSSQNRKSMLVL